MAVVGLYIMEGGAKMKLVLCRNVGAFSLSAEAVVWMRERGSKEAERVEIHPVAFTHHWIEIDRGDPILVACFEALGGERMSGGGLNSLDLVIIPDGTDYEIVQLDGGYELVIEKGHYW